MAENTENQPSDETGGDHGGPDKRDSAENSGAAPASAEPDEPAEQAPADGPGADAAARTASPPRAGAQGESSVWAWALPLNTFLMVAAGLSLYYASPDSPLIGGMAMAIGILAAIPFGYSVVSAQNFFTPYLGRINKISLCLLALIPIWQMNSFLLENAEIPIIQHLVSLALILALICLVIVIGGRGRDYDQKALTQHLALRAIDNSSWVYSFCLGVVFALAACLIIRVSLPGSVLDVKLLSRGLIPPITLMLFFAGMTDLLMRYWLVFSQSRKEDSALNLLLGRLDRGNHDITIEAIHTSLDRSGEFCRFLVYAIPILGFIGTVLGISLAAQGMGSMLTSASQDYSEVLTEALEPLGIAFDTTLIALSLSLVLGFSQSVYNTWVDRIIGKLIEINTPRQAPQASL